MQPLEYSVGTLIEKSAMIAMTSSVKLKPALFIRYTPGSGCEEATMPETITYRILHVIRMKLELSITWKIKN